MTHSNNTTRACLDCGVVIPARPRKVRCDACATEWHRQQSGKVGPGGIEYVCAGCGTVFLDYPSQRKDRTLFFCSQECQSPRRLPISHPTDPTAMLVPLTQGFFATIDREDVERVAEHNWYATVRAGFPTYARAKIGGKNMTLHRFILCLPARRPFVDHADGDGLNNRKRNIRTATPLQNVVNTPTRNRLGYRGVRYIRRQWQAVIQVDRQKRPLGFYATAEEAASAYDRAARELFGEFARLNFPEISES